MNSASLDTVVQILQWVLNTIFHQCVAVLACYMIWIPIENYSKPFAWHVILCTLGIFPITAEALILFFPSNVWSQEIDRKQKHWIHAILISLGMIFEIAGVSIGIYSKSTNPNAVHFRSAHAILGLLAIIFIVLTVVCGLISFNSQKFKTWAPSVWLKLGHNILGQTTYIFCVIALCLGLFTNYFSIYTSESSRIVATVFTVIIALWSLVCAWISTYHQIIAVRTL
ncbi:hypothetical protein RN001_000079 [Aquatica leii]|uniref:ascorbate ferrireductase (transmembrane) n=1 Tax=Aquatica leii TaxID=1421715 RepID=A0AAN7PEV2_9COLE|nr:hypothetical protein RN001_000079 [Aquatica leii]